VSVPPGSILLCLGLGSPADTLAAELLVRALREQGLDARHVSMGDFDAGSRPPDANPAAIAIVYLVSAFPSAERDHSEQAADRVRRHLPSARVVSPFLPGVALQSELPRHRLEADLSLLRRARRLGVRQHRVRPRMGAAQQAGNYRGG